MILVYPLLPTKMYSNLFQMKPFLGFIYSWSATRRFIWHVPPKSQVISFRIGAVKSEPPIGVEITVTMPQCLL